jgi:rhodanese-related sulfurtransferase
MDYERKREFKASIYEQFAAIGRALASAPRIEIIELLAQGEHTVEQVAAETGLSLANASQHLQVLRRARLVRVRRDGIHAAYSLADESVFRLWHTLRDFGEQRTAEIGRLLQAYLPDRSTLEAITAEELWSRVRAGRVTLLDVRPGAEYESAHIPGALSIPVAQLQQRLRELPRRREVVAYCRGPFCVFADEAVACLRAHGYKARRLATGLPDWRALGLPVESGSPGRPA